MAFGGITFTGQSTAFGVTTSAQKLTFAGASNMPTTKDRVGDPAVKPDTANNRLVLNAPGIYRVKAELSGTAASALQTYLQFYKGSTAYGKKSRYTWATTPGTQTLETIVEVLASDIPSGGGVATFADPDATAGAGKPAGGFAGAGAAPQTGVALNLYITGDGSVNLTLSDGSLSAERIG
jgi:hypothetical protein